MINETNIVRKNIVLTRLLREGSEAVLRKSWGAVLTCFLKTHLWQKPDFRVENFEGSAAYFRERPVRAGDWPVCREFHTRKLRVRNLLKTHFSDLQGGGHFYKSRSLHFQALRSMSRAFALSPGFGEMGIQLPPSVPLTPTSDPTRASHLPTLGSP